MIRVACRAHSSAKPGRFDLANKSNGRPALQSVETAFRHSTRNSIASSVPSPIAFENRSGVEGRFARILSVFRRPGVCEADRGGVNWGPSSNIIRRARFEDSFDRVDRSTRKTTVKDGSGFGRTLSARAVARVLATASVFWFATSSPAQDPSPKSSPAKSSAEGGGSPGDSIEAADDAYLPKKDDRRPETPLEKLRDLDDVESLEKLRKEASKPPLEFFVTRVAPFDVLPLVKPGHWSTLTVDAQANLGDYEGVLQTDFVALTKKQQVRFLREARLPKRQLARLSLQMFLPEFRKELYLELGRPDSIRADAGTVATFQQLYTHQMLVIALARDPSLYMPWSPLQAMISPVRDIQKSLSAEQRRYYRLVIPLMPDRPMLSAHPLTWTTISHVVWDNLAPESLSNAQQEALIDWLHFGGQLIVVGGAGSNLPALEESFLGRYLPADSFGETSPISAHELDALSEAYPPPLPPDDWPEVDALPTADFSTEKEKEQAPNSSSALLRLLRPHSPVPYGPVVRIRPLKNRQIYMSILKAREGAVSLPFGETANDPGRPLGVERRVGRGRVLMLSIRPTDPAIVGWKGFDTFLRRVILRRPEEPWNRARSVQSRMLGAPELTWFRLLGRDLGAPGAPLSVNPAEIALPKDSVAEWSDESKLPRLCRETLEDASGISIPTRSFVLRVLLAFAFTVVPLNYLICRFVFRRRELAWVFVPVLSLGFAVAVERGAARRLGFDSARDEIDLLEIQADYPRAHLTRIAALYSTGRVQFNVAFPGDPTALALPFSRTESLATAETAQTAWESLPEPSLRGFPVQPRSLGLYRAEQIHPLGGVVRYSTKPSRRIFNQTNMNLYDAVLIDVGSGSDLKKTPIGAIPSGATIDLDALARLDTKSRPRMETKKVGWTSIEPFLTMLSSYSWSGPENVGERRLVAWTPDSRGGQTVTPSVDRVRGFTLVVVHLTESPPPSPFSSVYDGSVQTTESR